MDDVDLHFFRRLRFSKVTRGDVTRDVTGIGYLLNADVDPGNDWRHSLAHASWRQVSGVRPGTTVCRSQPTEAFHASFFFFLNPNVTWP